MALGAVICLILWQKAVAAAPTFTEQAGPIIVKNCVTCHRAGGVAASSPLDSYDAARRSAVGIKDQVLNRTMPPWLADPKRSLPFRNDPRLSDEDIATLAAWVDAGAAKGPDGQPTVARPTGTEGWRGPNGRRPDAVLSLPEFAVPATDVIPYVQVLVKAPTEHDRWISALQVRPGNAAVVHHVGIAEVALADGVQPKDLEALDQMARQLGMPNGAALMSRPAVLDPENPTTYDMLAVYTPGTTIETYGAGNAKLLRGGKNMYINFNIHYTATGKPEKDRSQLALWFQAQRPDHVLYRIPASGKTLIANGRQLLADDAGTKAEGTDVAITPIKPFEANYELVGVTAFTNPVTLFQFQPHAHLRATDFHYVVVYPDGRTVSVLNVPKYDFHWQLAYDLETPLALPAGAKLIVTAHYDNSSSNLHLREAAAHDPTHNCGPDKVVYFRDQNQTWDEMFSPIMQYSIDRAGPHGHRSLKMATAVGCMVHDASGRWMLDRATNGGASDTASTSRPEIARDAGLPLGTARYRLIGPDPFEPQRFAGSKVAAKGVLIAGRDGPRLNVTSLQPLDARCD